MKLGEVCILSVNVRRQAEFYKNILAIDNGSDDNVRQVLIKGETVLLVVNDGLEKSNNNTNMCLVFECEDVDAEYERLLQIFGRKLHFIETPHDSGEYRTMSFYDLDGNRVYLRSRI